MALFPQSWSAIERRCRNAGERLVLHQLKRCLSDDYWVWHDVPLGPRARQPDVVVFSPRRGLLILEVKHWALGKLRGASPDQISLMTDRGVVELAHPLVQARSYALELNNLLQADPLLRFAEGPFKGKSLIPYGWGCVLSAVRRKAVATMADFDDVFAPHKTLLRDDLDETLAPYELEKRLWGMMQIQFPFALSLPQRDRVRWHLFPELRVATPPTEPDHSACQALNLTAVMDLQQEQLARSLGEGHRVIHGPAGSGKTMILVYRAHILAQQAQADRPVLVLCFKRALVNAVARARRVAGKHRPPALRGHDTRHPPADPERGGRLASGRSGAAGACLQYVARFEERCSGAGSVRAVRLETSRPAPGRP